MKYAALALVLIVASAVVLIFANTLNSWVLGGLIGGLAALLISIPISLLIFTSLARRHDEFLAAQLAHQPGEREYQEYDEGVEYDEYVENDDYEQQRVEVYETEAYLLPAPDDPYDDEYDAAAYRQDQYDAEVDRRYEREIRRNRNDRVERLPAPGQTTASASARREPEPQRRPSQPPGNLRQSRSPHTTRNLRSTQQAAALRKAMREAAHEHRENENTTVVSHPHRKAPFRQPDKPSQAQPPFQHPQQRNSSDLQTGGNTTDAQRGRYPTTGPMRLNPDTGKIARNPQIDEAYNTSETWTGSLNNPMVRRAPYLYEDDPLRQELAQHVEKPIARRSSRFLPSPEQEQEQQREK